MKAILVHESYKASTALLTREPQPITTLSAVRNSHAACQLLLHDGKRNHYIIGEEFSIPDEIEIPMIRIEIISELPVKAQFIDYYVGQHELAYADKLLEQTAKTYPGDRYAPLYLEWQIDETIKPQAYPVKIKVYRTHLTSQEECLLEKSLTIEVDAFTFPKEYLERFHLNMWQQPSNLARTFDVPLWSDAHFDLIKEMAQSLAAIGQKAITVIAGEIPWKGWFNYIVKDYPANLYEYSMVKVKKTQAGQLHCDFSILTRYLECFFEAGISEEIDVFGLLGVWEPPFFPLVDLDHPEKLVIRFYDEEKGTFGFIHQKAELQEYLRQVFVYFKEKNLWEKVRIVSDEPKKHQIDSFRASLAVLKDIDETIQIKAAFDKEDVLFELLPVIDHPVTSYYCTCNHYETLAQSHPGRTQYYVCNYPDKPNTFLHSPLLETRMQGILAYQFKTDGFLRWAYNCWPQNARTDIRYNTSSLPIGDLCFIYPGNHGHLLLSLRYKQLQRGIEDFYLLKTAQATQPQQTDALVADFLNVTDTKNWMIDSHHSHPDVFLQTAEEMEAFRQALRALLVK
ncbi:DUF4091 domain-containing protein [Enterococcus casseliflavus]|uniref:DUF4091 domain-containing protein n=1 Tax=unclassified Enterococcus TaxID=2608891 RepID=UPI001C70743C|nr:DUF4091 domain-containing protein [Enterococcus casseliflavus]